MALNCIQSRSVSVIHAFHFASIRKQLICRDLSLCQIESPKNKNQIVIFSRIFTFQVKSLNVLKSRFKSQSRLGFAYHWRPHTAASGAWDRQTDGRTDTVPFHRLCSAYHATSANNVFFWNTHHLVFINFITRSRATWKKVDKLFLKIFCLMNVTGQRH